jgi:putative flippase GtrA
MGTLINLTRKNWRKFLIFGGIGYSIAILRGFLLEGLINWGYEENRANVDSLVASAIMAFILHYLITWQKDMLPLPFMSRANLVRFVVIAGPFLLIVAISIVIRIKTYPILDDLNLFSPFLIVIFQDSVLGGVDFVIHNIFTFTRLDKTIQQRIPIFRRYSLNTSRE